MLKKMLLSGVSLASLAGVTLAPDPLKARPLAPVYVPTWTGCYVGGHAGYGVANSSSEYSPGTVTVSTNANLPFGTPRTLGYNFGSVTQDFDNRGFVGGAQVGCQLQTGIFLWGVEGDWSSFSNSSERSFAGSTVLRDFQINDSVDQRLKFNSLWSIRGRFGGIFSDVYHLYATAGLGGANASYSASQLRTDFEGATLSSHAFSSASEVSLNMTGIVFGAGAEWKVLPHFVIGAEYLHYALASNNDLPPGPGPFIGTGKPPLFFTTTHVFGPGSGDHVHINAVDVIRLRASYLFQLGPP
jgi:outer membrane immunogenic protein